MAFLIPKTVLASMISHALEADPQECCGVLIGDGDTADEARRIKNVHSQPIRRYEMAPTDLMRAESEAEAKGRKIVAIYHSHTHTQAYPSQTDVNNAVETWWTEPYYVLISLVEKNPPNRPRISHLRQRRSYRNGNHHRRRRLYRNYAGHLNSRIYPPP